MRRIRLRDGAMQWGLFVDSSDHSSYTEVFLVKSWIEHLRQHERGTHEELMEGCGFYREIAEHGLADSVFLQADLEEREEVARL